MIHQSQLSLKMRCHSGMQITCSWLDAVRHTFCVRPHCRIACITLFSVILGQNDSYGICTFCFLIQNESFYFFKSENMMN